VNNVTQADIRNKNILLIINSIKEINNDIFLKTLITLLSRKVR